MSGILSTRNNVSNLEKVTHENLDAMCIKEEDVMSFLVTNQGQLTNRRGRYDLLLILKCEEGAYRMAYADYNRSTKSWKVLSHKSKDPLNDPALTQNHGYAVAPWKGC